MEGFSQDLFDVFQTNSKPGLNIPVKRAREEDIEEVEYEEPYTVKKEEIDGCVHEAVYPKTYTPLNISIPEPAKKFPFELDPFQKRAIRCIEQNESVLVAAHTSAGKTAIADYAIAQSLIKKQRVIYTSPIKALSNQKYREFHDEFSDVGLMTGDVTINEGASCLVMTTEILRSMLYKGSEVIREMAWVIFDEIHYMRDKERGVVWEESIILLPQAIRLIFLSATIPNAREFAEWICKIKDQPCHVVYTEYRPTPLQHFIFPAGGEGLFLVVDESGKFLEKNFRKAISYLNEEQKHTNKKIQGNNGEVVKIVQLIMERDLKPAIIFSFSKRECEAYAMGLNKFDYSTAEEKEMIQTTFENAIQTLSDEDKELPMIGNVLPLLKRGIGIHHGGLLPIIKEITEILFQEGLVKCLFSTETFSMGLNMPARTVVFTNARKFDGENFRWISGGEYIQMSGRAGRRGIDDKGICVLMVDQKMEPEIAKGMLKGNMDPLNSTFHLSYNMLLNLMRIEDSHPEQMIRKSFHQFQNDRATPEIYKKKKELQDELNKIVIVNELEFENLKQIQATKAAYEKIMNAYIQQPEKILKFLSPGRLVYVVDSKGNDWGWGVVTGFKKSRIDKKRLKNVQENISVLYKVDVILHVSIIDKPYPLKDLNTDGDMTVIPMYLECIEKVSTIRLHLSGDSKSKEGLKQVLNSLREVYKKLNGHIPLLDPVKDIGITDPEVLVASGHIAELKQKESELSILSSPDFYTNQQQYEAKENLEAAIGLLNKQLKASKTMILRDDWKAMRRVLRRLGFSSEEHVELKGRVACEISTSDELLTTELMLSGVFKDLPVDVMVSLLSCLVHQENSSEASVPKIPELASAYQLLLNTAKHFSEVFVQSKLNIDQDAYVNSYKPSLMEAVFEWAHGAKFAEICLLTDIYEGTIIRCIRRLHELLRQLQDASKSIQSLELSTKFTQGLRMIERGIVFTASLYL
jgi:ATP-dependent RNA helicase DOB1